MDLLLKNVQLNSSLVDIAISDGVIKSIGVNLQEDATRTLDCKQAIALPGLVDLHTHLREPGKEDSETVLSG